MRSGTYVSIAACMMAGAMAAGCSSGSSGGSGGSGGGAAASSASSAPAASSALAAAESAPPGAPGGGAAGGGSVCQPVNLAFALGARGGMATQPTQAVDMTNRGSAACTMDGFPGVDLIGVANGQPDYSWSLVRQSARYSPVTLKPGGTAHFVVTYLPDSSGSGDISVVKMEITPPNAFTQAELTWNQSVLLQDSATRPGTYISPVTPGA